MACIEKVPIEPEEKCLFEFQLPSKLIVFDHVLQQLFITISGQGGNNEALFKDVLNTLNKQLNNRDYQMSNVPSSLDWGQVQSNMSKESYIASVEKVKSHIVEGDIFQAVISQQFSLPHQKDPLTVYRSLRNINPSPYMYFFNYADRYIIGSSPEILVQSHHQKARVRPIAGTRKRSFKK